MSTLNRTFDPTTTSGAAVAELFRTWCRLRGDDPEGEVSGADFVTAAGELFEHLGLDVGGPASQVAPAAGQHVYTDGEAPAQYDDVTPSQYVYPKNLVDDLREALTEWFDDNPEHTRPEAVSFHITHDYDDGPAWSTYGPTFHYGSDPEREERHDIPVDQLPSVDFDRTAVADALIEIGDFEQPQDGDTLRIALHPSA
ncbi:hypothetical protein [Streptomyces rochei]|uniref:hypothetical protein n=1 Tax=Streptomyces rochei TaxID=1928 RepID=UPI0036FCFA6F